MLEACANLKKKINVYKPHHIHLLPSVVYSSPPALNLQCKSIPKYTYISSFEIDTVRIVNFHKEEECSCDTSMTAAMYHIASF